MNKARPGGIEAVDLVVFDLDGTLVDDTVYILEANPRASRTVPIAPS